LRCSSNSISEVWYSYYVRGSVQTGEFEATDPVGTTDNCSGNIYYYPKSGASTTTTTTTPATGTPTSQPTGSVWSGSGHLSVTTSGVSKGCLISAGTWYVSGTCATYTATPSGAGFTLSSSKGACGVTSGKFVCSGSTAAGVFVAVDGKLVFDAGTTWYASGVPSGITQVSVYTTSVSGRTTELSVGWTAV
jgi:ribonuclease T2